MTEKELQDLQYLSNDISQLKQELESVKEILSDYDNFGSDISFTRNSDSKRRSFGSKKHNIKPQLKEVLLKIEIDKEKELNLLKDKFDKLKII